MKLLVEELENLGSDAAIYCSHNTSLLEHSYIKRYFSVLHLIDQREIQPSRAYPENPIFQAGLLYEHDGFKIYVRQDEFQK